MTNEEKANKMNETKVGTFTVYVETSTADTEWEVCREFDETVYIDEMADKLLKIAQMSRKNQMNQNYIVVNSRIAHLINLDRKLKSDKLLHKLKFVRKELNELFGK